MSTGSATWGSRRSPTLSSPTALPTAADLSRTASPEFVAPLEIKAYQPQVAQVYGRIRAHLRRAGRPIGPLDLLIAAHALYLGSVLVTNNVDEFARVPHLNIENWAAAAPPGPGTEPVGGAELGKIS